MPLLTIECRAQRNIRSRESSRSDGCRFCCGNVAFSATFDGQKRLAEGVDEGGEVVDGGFGVDDAPAQDGLAAPGGQELGFAGLGALHVGFLDVAEAADVLGEAGEIEGEGVVLGPKVLEEVVVFPATHYVAGEERMKRAIGGIEVELQERLAWFEKQGKLLEAQRLRMRTSYDLEMMQ